MLKDRALEILAFTLTSLALIMAPLSPAFAGNEDPGSENEVDLFDDDVERNPRGWSRLQTAGYRYQLRPCRAQGIRLFALAVRHLALGEVPLGYLVRQLALRRQRKPHLAGRHPVARARGHPRRRHRAD